jgi:PAS domain S-box-containing protein
MKDFHLCTDKEITPNAYEIEAVINSAYDAMIAVNEYGIINILNTAAERILGVTAEAVLGCPLSEIFPGSRLEFVLRSGKPELNQQQDIGNVRVVSNSVPVRDANHCIIGAAAVFRDVTDVKKLAEEITGLKEIQEMLEAIINSSQDVISVVDDKGEMILVNPAYTRLIGIAREDVIGKPPTVDIRHGDSVHLRVLQTKEPVRGVPLRVGPQNKEVLVNAAPIIVNGRLRGSVAVAHDVSEIKRLTAELDQMKSLVRRMNSSYTFEDIIGRSPVMQTAVQQASNAAATPATVLLTGESGTGKELFAHAIHHASKRSQGPFIRVNCAAIPETLLESELFGYKEGAFTGARRGGKKGLFLEANEGTIFLDEIGEIAPAVQVKLLRVLQEKEIVPVGGTKAIRINVRVIAATNLDLRKAVQNGTFREDLYYRINVFPIFLPPLRKRLQDLPQLIDFLLRKLNQEYGRHVKGLEDSALEILTGYNWPGNVRELENILGRALINMRLTEDRIQGHHLPALNGDASPAILLNEPAISETDPGAPVKPLAEVLEAAEQQAIQGALAATGGNRVEAAKRLGIAVRSLYYKLERNRCKSE